MTQLMHHLMFDPLSEVERLEWTSAFVCSAIVVGVGLVTLGVYLTGLLIVRMWQEWAEAEQATRDKTR
jgi:hypothetical protein